MTTAYRRAALLVDFDNIYSSLHRDDPAAARTFAMDPLRWSNWLQDRLGAVGPDADETVPRVLLERSCYLNPHAFGKYRTYFTHAGFRVVDCPGLTKEKKNGADIHMVIDALDLLAHPTRYDEFILLSLDADFTPLFQRLRSHDRRVVMLGSGPSSAALRNTCDFVIPNTVFVQEALLEEDFAEPLAAGPVADAGLLQPVPAPGGVGAAVWGAGDHDGLREALAEAVRQMVRDSPQPLRMATVANDLRKQFGGVVLASRWAGTGGFKAFVQSISGDAVQSRIEGVVAFVYEPGRHDIDRVMAAASRALALRESASDTSRFSGPWADAAARVCRVLGFPALLPSEWARLLSGVAAELAAGTYIDMATLERDVAAATGESRSSVRFLGAALSEAGYDLWAAEHTPRGIGVAFHDHMLRLAENAQLVLEETDLPVLREWLLSEVRD